MLQWRGNLTKAYSRRSRLSRSVLAHGPRQPSSLLKLAISGWKVRVNKFFLLLVIGMAVDASALLVKYDVHRHVQTVPAIIRGKVIAVETTESRELGYRSVEGYLFRHASAAIIVSEVLKNATAQSISSGDTIRLIYPSSDWGRKVNTQDTVWAEDVRLPAFVKEQSGVFALTYRDSDWYPGSYYCFRDTTEPEEIREAIRMHVTSEATSKSN